MTGKQSDTDLKTNRDRIKTKQTTSQYNNNNNNNNSNNNKEDF